MTLDWKSVIWRRKCRIAMNECRISKYNEKYRINGIYTRDEWTSMSDIGKKYGNIIFTYDEYVKVETKYLNVIKNILNAGKVKFLQIQGLEDYKHVCQFTPKQKVYLCEILNISQDCLREKYWCRLESDKMFIHFGYDYYMYIGSNLTYDEMKKIVDEQGLYIEKRKSPYKVNSNL